MNQARAQEVVKRYLSDSDKEEFEGLIGANNGQISNEEMIEAAGKVTALFDRNSIQIIAQPISGSSKMNLFVMYKGDIVE